MHSIALGITALMILAILFNSIKKNTTQNLHFSNLLIIAAIGLFVRMVLTPIYSGHPIDINCFSAWSETLIEKGFAAFYNIPNYHSDYPPLYMYVLYAIGMIRQLFGIEQGGYTHVLMLKLPAILSDVFSGLFLYKIAASFIPMPPNKDKFSAFGTYTPAIIALLYVLNPAMAFTSSIWGQVDSILALMLAVSLYNLLNKRYLISVLVFTAAILFKPQALMMSPIFIYAFVNYLRDEQFSLKAFGKLIIWAFSCMLLAFVLCLPFAWGEKLDFWPVINQYLKTIGQYPYLSFNAYNVYALAGLNFVSVDGSFLFLSYSAWGLVFIGLITLFAFYMLFRKKSFNIFYVAAFICISVFMLSMRMHERYALPALLFLLIAYAYKRDRRILLLYWGFSLSFLLNIMDALRYAIEEYSITSVATTSIFLSIPNVILFVAMIPLGFMLYKQSNTEETPSTPEEIPSEEVMVEEIPPEEVLMDEVTNDTVSTEEDLTNDNPSDEPTGVIWRTEKLPKITRRDVGYICLITLIYALVAFFRLGDRYAAESFVTMDTGQFFVVELSEETDIGQLQFFQGVRTDKALSVSGSYDGKTYTEPVKFEAKSVFKWHFNRLDMRAKYIKITSNSREFYIHEIGLRDMYNNLIPIMSVTPGYENVVDEQSIVPAMSTYMNSTIFDEVYHPRTAYEFINKLEVYEWTHPQLGKVIMSIGVKLLGMSPLGYRLMGTLFGVFMIPIMYIFGKKMFGTSLFAVFTAVLLSADFMHFVQTRLATIDTYITIFVMLMYLFMYMYYRTSFYDTKLSKTLMYLFFSGLFMGLGISAKWPGVYAGMGLAVIFFLVIIQRYKEYVFAKEKLANNVVSEEYIQIVAKFKKYTLITLGCCVVFFIVIPLIIYLVSYIPYYLTGSLYAVRENNPLIIEGGLFAKLLPDSTLGNYLAAVIQNQKDMFGYHSDLTEPHPYGAPWYLWPLTLRPIFYYAADFSDSVRAGISSFGNPLIWWGGFGALIFGVYKMFKGLDRRMLFLFIAWMAQILTWMFVSRVTFIYHYFPCVPFVILLIGQLFYWFRDKPRIKRNMIIFASISVVLFICFYPVLAGVPVNTDWARRLLQWIPGMWQLL